MGDFIATLISSKPILVAKLMGYCAIRLLGGARMSLNPDLAAERYLEALS
jgi:hypothetical protein